MDKGKAVCRCLAVEWFTVFWRLLISFNHVADVGMINCYDYLFRGYDVTYYLLSWSGCTGGIKINANKGTHSLRRMPHSLAALPVNCAHALFFKSVWECSLLFGEMLDKEATPVISSLSHFFWVISFEPSFYALSPLSILLFSIYLGAEPAAGWLIDWRKIPMRSNFPTQNA